MKFLSYSQVAHVDFVQEAKHAPITVSNLKV